MALIKGSITMFKRKLSLKRKGLVSFISLCAIEWKHFKNTLGDPLKSINLMFLPVFSKLSLGDVKPTIVSLLLTHSHVKQPKRKVNNV